MNSTVNICLKEGKVAVESIAIINPSLSRATSIASGQKEREEKRPRATLSRVPRNVDDNMPSSSCNVRLVHHKESGDMRCVADHVCMTFQSFYEPDYQ